MAFPIQSEFLSTKEISLLRSKIAAPSAKRSQKCEIAFVLYSAAVLEYTHYSSMRLVMFKCHLQQCSFSDSHFTFFPFLPLIKQRLNGLQELLLWKSRFLHVSLASTQGICLLLEYLTQWVWMFRFQQVQKCLNVSLNFEVFSLIPCQSSYRSIHPHLPSSPTHSFLFPLVLSFLYLNLPWFSFNLSHLLHSAIRSVFFPHSSNIPQLVWSLKSEEFKDASLIFLSV